MSGPERQPEPLVSTTQLKRKHFTDEDLEELDRLDAVFRRVKKAVPRAPYILSTPSLDPPYKYHSRHESRAWMLGHLFTPDEEHLQYRTFHFREPYQDCFTLQHGEDDEPELPRPKSQPSHAASQAPKKKISLSDYRSKQANGVITPGSKKISPNLLPTKPIPVQQNGLRQDQKPPPSAQKPEEAIPKKRPAPEPIASEKPEKRTREDRPSAPPSEPPQKPEPADSQINLDRSSPSNATPHGLPPLLSPVDEPLSNPYGLPAILSPTLPSNVQAELDRLESQRKRGDSNASTSSSDRNRGQLLAVPDSRSQKHEDGPKSNSRARSVSLNGKSPNAKSPNAKSPGGSSLKRSVESEPSLIVKLKYTKKARETIKRLLNLPPKREALNERREREDAPKDRPVKTQSKAVDGMAAKPKPTPKVAARRSDSSTPSSKALVATAKVAEKRPRTEDDMSHSASSKRKRAESLQDGPITPKEQILSSPALSNKSSAQKSQGPYATPRRDHRAINMLRSGSGEGYDATPGMSGVTPAGKHLDVKAPTSAPLNSKKQADHSLLQNTSMKLNQMGRSLKHEGQKLENEKGNQKRAAVMGLECILSYMAAFHAQDLAFHLRGRPVEVESTWKTLSPLCVSYTRLTKDVPHLDGFRSYLGAVIAAHICTLLAPRVPNTKTHDSPHKLARAELDKQHKELTDHLALLSEHYMKILRHSQDARIALPAEDIEKSYSKTWAGRELNAKLAKGPERPNGARLSGPYFLPLGNDTTPIQAVRFGLKFLGEYCEREGIEYGLRVNLDRIE